MDTPPLLSEDLKIINNYEKIFGNVFYSNDYRLKNQKDKLCNLCKTIKENLNFSKENSRLDD